MDTESDAAVGASAPEELPSSVGQMGEEQMDAVYDTVFDLVEVEWLSDVITIAIAVAFTAFVAHAATKLIRRILSHDSVPLPSSSIFINISRVFIWCVGLSIILESKTDIDMSNLITALGIGGIAISLGFQDTLSNLIGGLQISIMGIVEPGDHIAVGSDRGVVTDVTWRHTIIRDFSGNQIIIPNSVINKGTLIKLPPLSKIVVPISVTTDGRDLDALAKAVEKAADEAAATVSPVISPAAFLFTSVTEFGFAGNVVVYVEDGTQVNFVKDAIVRATALIARSFDGEEKRADQGEGQSENGEENVPE